MNVCSICEKHKEDDPYLIYENDYFKISHGPLESNILGYIYIEPRRHVESWSELSNEELEDLTTSIRRLEVLLNKTINAVRVYTVTISESVRHLHFHIIPRVKDQHLKGLPLIEQATQQKIIEDRIISQEIIIDFIKNARFLINKNNY
jgi:diadenosine tetraphosphate (Ap4A) HIT family hydrolase